jgi:GxxExxY protein
MAIVQRDPVGSAIIAAAIDVHRALGPGLLEMAYKTCLVHELMRRGLRVKREVPVPVTFKDVRIDCGFRLDLLVEDTVIVELKCVERLVPVHTAQVITYLRLTGARQAFLINFNGVTLKEGLKSFLGDGVTRSQ